VVTDNVTLTNNSNRTGDRGRPQNNSSGCAGAFVAQRPDPSISNNNEVRTLVTIGLHDAAAVRLDSNVNGCQCHRIINIHDINSSAIRERLRRLYNRALSRSQPLTIARPRSKYNTIKTIVSTTKLRLRALAGSFVNTGGQRFEGISIYNQSRSRISIALRMQAIFMAESVIDIDGISGGINILLQFCKPFRPHIPGYAKWLRRLNLIGGKSSEKTTGNRDWIYG
jgi:hypothetical protein